MKIKEAQVYQWLDQVKAEEISFSRMVELINEEANKVEWFKPSEKMPKEDDELVIIISVGNYKFQQNMLYFKHRKTWFKKLVHAWRLRRAPVPIPSEFQN